MKRLLYKFTIVLFTSLQCFPQINPGARQIALSHSDVALSNDAFSIFNNPAGLAHSPSPFGMKELANGFGAYTEPTTFGTLSAGFMIYGFELYKETKMALGYGNKIANYF